MEYISEEDWNGLGYVKMKGKEVCVLTTHNKNEILIRTKENWSENETEVIIAQETGNPICVLTIEKDGSVKVDPMSGKIMMCGVFQNKKNDVVRKPIWKDGKIVLRTFSWFKRFGKNF